MGAQTSDHVAIRRMVTVVALANLAYFGVEVGVAAAIGSVSLAADSVDFLEDASINLMVLLALGWSVAARARVAMLLAGIILLPSLAALWLALGKIAQPLPPEPFALSLTGGGALLVNVGCALLLTRVRRSGGSLTLAAFLSSRNDAAANVAVIVAGMVTALWPSAWPDVLVGLGIGVLNAGAAHEVFASARADGNLAWTADKP